MAVQLPRAATAVTAAFGMLLPVPGLADVPLDVVRHPRPGGATAVNDRSAHAGGIQDGNQRLRYLQLDRGDWVSPPGHLAPHQLMHEGRVGDDVPLESVPAPEWADVLVDPHDRPG